MPGSGERRIDAGLMGLKSHVSAHLALILFWSGKPLIHLLMRLTDESVVGAAHGDQHLEALDENVLLLASTCSSTR
jgi:hypothetical protein